MSLHSRYVALALVGCSALLVSLSFPSLSSAQPTDASATAEKLNAEGKALIQELNLEGAAAKFREAIRLVEDPRYAFNLCYTLEKSGGLEEAKRACKWVTGSTNPRLAKKAAVLLKKVEAKLKARVKQKPANPAVPPSPTGETPVPPVSPPSEFPTSPPPQGPPSGSTTAMPSGASPSGNGYPPPGVRTPPIAPLPMPSAAPLTNRWGLRIGATSSFADNLGESDGAVFSGVVGAMYTRSFSSPFQVIFEGQFARRGTELVGADFFADIDEVNLVLSYLDISSTSRFSIGQGRLKPFLEVGSTLSFLLLSELSGDEMVADPEVPFFDFSLNFGGGLLLGSFEFRVLHMRGLLDLSGESVRGPSNSRSTQFEVGYWF